MKKVLSLTMALVMLLTSMMAFSMTASAEEENLYDKEINGIFYEYSIKDGAATIRYAYVSNDLKKSTVTLPSKLSGKPVRAVESFYCYGNKYVKTLVIPDSVVSIGGTQKGDFYQRFFGDKLSTVKLGKGVKSIRFNPFGFGIKTITLAKGNKNLKLVNGVLYNKKMTVLYVYPSEKTGKSFTVPKSVKTINYNAFNFNKYLKSINLSNVRKICPDAFTDTFLVKVVAGTRLKSFTAEAFTRCNSLKSFKIAKKNKKFSVKNGVVFNKKGTKLVLYPNNRKGTSYTVPKKVTAIGKNAFAFTFKLTKITVPSGVTVLESGAFSGCTKAVVNVPSKLKTIGNRAYEDTNVKKVALPKTVTSMGYESFRFCSKLTDADLSKTQLKTIQYNSFYSTGLKNVKLPNTLKTIRWSAFSDTKLTAVTIPAGVTKIESYVFDGNMKVLTVKGKNTALDYDALWFESDVNIPTIRAPKGSKAEAYAKEYGCNFIEL